MIGGTFNYRTPEPDISDGTISLFKLLVKTQIKDQYDKQENEIINNSSSQLECSARLAMLNDLKQVNKI